MRQIQASSNLFPLSEPVVLHVLNDHMYTNMYYVCLCVLRTYVVAVDSQVCSHTGLDPLAFTSHPPSFSIFLYRSLGPATIPPSHRPSGPPSGPLGEAALNHDLCEGPEDVGQVLLRPGITEFVTVTATWLDGHDVSLDFPGKQSKDLGETMETCLYNGSFFLIQ